MPRVRIALAISTLLLFTSFAAPALAQHAHEGNPDAFPTTFETPHVDLLADGKVVVNIELRGERRGMLTLNLSPDPAGFMTGTWVVAERYTDNTDPATGIEPPAHDEETAEQHEIATANADAEHPHRDYVRYVDNGTLAGTIDAASLDFAADGALVDFRARLTITMGSRIFEGATGSGLADRARGLALVINGGVR